MLLGVMSTLVTTTVHLILILSNDGVLYYLYVKFHNICISTDNGDNVLPFGRDSGHHYHTLHDRVNS